jgi:hypothetical protein
MAFWQPRSVSRHRTRLILVGIFLLTALGLMARMSFAHAPTPARAGGSPESLTQALLAANRDYQAAPRGARARRLAGLLRIAATRYQLLAAIIDRDPGAVLRVAVPAGFRAGLPPAVHADVEEEVDLDGVLEVLHEDHPTESRYLYFLEASGARFSLHFAADPPTHLLTGSRVRVQGVRVNGTLALGSGSTSVQTMAAAMPNTFGAHSTVVLLVNFPDNPIQPYTLDYARSVVFGAASDFFLENSYQQTWLTGDVFGWYTIPLSSTVCDITGLDNYAESAATAAGVNLSGYTHRVYVFPPNACGWTGSATIGGNPSRAWINGSLGLQAVGHEMGHNLGLQHSHSWVCNDTGTASGTMTGPYCFTLEYGDGLDIMGWSASGHFNAFQKERLGWLNYGVSPPITTVQTGGTYVLDPYEPTSSTPKALKILKSSNPTTGYRDWYYVEFRQAIGFSQMNSSNILNGVVIHTGSEESGYDNRLLDMTPETYDLYARDPALTVGRSLHDPDAGVTITLASVGSTGAAVSVAFSTPTCTRVNPTVAVSPSQSQGVPAGTAVTYTVSVTNNDGADCAASSFSLQTMAPLTGWTATFVAPTLTLSPGASTSTTLTVTSAASAAAGTYTVPVVVTNMENTSYTATGSAVYVIGSTLDVSVSADKPSYTRGQTVSLTARVSSGGSPVSNASVTFTMTKSNGRMVRQTATTDSTGSAVGKFRLKSSDPVGAYKARTDATKAPLSGSATTSFTVE